MENTAKSASSVRAGTLHQIFDYVQTTVLMLLAILIVGSFGLTVMSLFGILPWLQLSASFGATPIDNAGAAVQILFTLFCLSLLVFLPANARILALEKTHRTFALNLDDITHAYAVAHAADRAGAFALSQDFDDMRQRLAHLRAHPDLKHLEPEILELSAQMSFIARDLAQVYSDKNVTRARSFLTQRQEEVERYGELVGLAVKTCAELKRWIEDIEAEERVAKAQIARLDADLAEILPRIGYAFETEDSTVVPMSKKTAAKTIESGNRA